MLITYSKEFVGNGRNIINSISPKRVEVIKNSINNGYNYLKNNNIDIKDFPGDVDDMYNFTKQHLTDKHGIIW